MGYLGPGQPALTRIPEQKLEDTQYEGMAHVRTVLQVDSLEPALVVALIVLLVNTPQSGLVRAPRVPLASTLQGDGADVITVVLEGTPTPALVAAHTALMASIRRLLAEAHVLRVRVVRTQPVEAMAHVQTARPDGMLPALGLDIVQHVLLASTQMREADRTRVHLALLVNGVDRVEARVRTAELDGILLSTPRGA